MSQDQDLDTLLDETFTQEDVLELAIPIVAAYVGHNTVAVADLPGVIATVFQGLQQTLASASAPVPLPKQEPAVPVKKSITDEYLICLEDGKKLKMLKRHLKSAYDLTPDQYRAKWGLPADYPMTAPKYAEARSHLAKKIGLGRARPGLKAKSST